MSKGIARRSLFGAVCQRCPRPAIPARPSYHPFSSTTAIAAPNDDQSASSPSSPRERKSPTSDLARLLGKTAEPKKPNPTNQPPTPGLGALANIFASRQRDQQVSQATAAARGDYSPNRWSSDSSGGSVRRTSTMLDYDNSVENPLNRLTPDLTPPHHFHVYATKHNTHITLTRPNRDPIISVSAGNINFKKAARGTYDAAYQLAAWTMKTMQEKGLMAEITQLEVVLRGFGVGRDAVTKALLGTEGRNLRGSVVRVTDATRLKFGGTRSPKPRRLG